MDILLSIVTGLGLRLFLAGLDESLERINPILLGLWEGATVHHLSNSNKPSSYDHYLAYALRVAVDLFFTANVQRTFTVVVWTALGLVVSEAVIPSQYYQMRHNRRHRISRSIPAHVRVYQSPIIPQLAQTPLTHTPPARRASHRPASPPLRPSRPPSPPSFFLEGESDTNSNSPKPAPRYLPSALSEHDSDSSPLPILLPTPPATLVTEGRKISTEHSRQRLSTIEELSSSEENSRLDYLDIPGGHAGFTKTLPSYAPSAATTAPPLPIPNSTIQYSDMDINRPSLADNSNMADIYDPPMATRTTPLPVPNPGTHYTRPEWRPSSPSEPDELRTPHAAHWELTDHDELRTPIGPPKELSPLFSDQHLLPDFGTAKIMEPITTHASVPQASAIRVGNVTSSTGNGPPSLPPTPVVEYFSSPVVGPEPEPDPDKLSETGSLQTETDATSVITDRNASQLYSKAELLRNQAREKETERVRLMKQLTVAANEARIKDVLFLREDIRVSETQARKLHERAARRFFKARNSNKRTQTVDVHGLRVVEAIQITEKALREALTNGHPFIKVIVGKGLHSQGGKPILKQALMKTMEGQKIPCSVDPKNSGVLVLRLD